MAGQPRTREQEGRPPAPGATGYTRTHPPYEHGNLEALKHGAASPRKVAPIAAEVSRLLVESAPWTARAPFAGARASLAWVEGQLVLLRAWIDEHGILDGEGEPQGAVGLLQRLEARASTLRSELGLTPQALAKLLSTLAGVAAAGGDEDELEALKREGAAIISAREAALTEGSGDE